MAYKEEFEYYTDWLLLDKLILVLRDLSTAASAIVDFVARTNRILYVHIRICGKSIVPNDNNNNKQVC